MYFHRVIVDVRTAVEMSCLAIWPALLLGTLILEKNKKIKEEEKGKQIRF